MTDTSAEDEYTGLGEADFFEVFMTLLDKYVEPLTRVLNEGLHVHSMNRQQGAVIALCELLTALAPNIRQSGKDWVSTAKHACGDLKSLLKDKDLDWSAAGMAINNTIQALEKEGLTHSEHST